MDKSTVRVIGALYLALCQGLSDQGVALANDLLYAIADRSQSHEATVLRIIANSAVHGADCEPEELPEEPKRPAYLRVVENGAA